MTGHVHRRRAIALVTISVAFGVSVSYWLAATGSSSSSISTPAGAPPGGAVAAVTAMSASVTRTNGAAQLDTGVALAKLSMSKTVTDRIRVEVAWTDAVSGARVLNNPNAQISVGIYHTIHTGSCNAASQSVDAPLINLTDTDSNSYCAALDQSSTGRFVSSTGKLLLAANQIEGFLLPKTDGSGALNACTSSATDTDAWCQPASVTNSDQRALFVVASIVTPGGLPQGQQPDLNNLSFYTDVRPQG
jgi:hypothetical protein